MKKIEKAAVLIIILHIISTYTYLIGQWLVSAVALNGDSYIKPMLLDIPLLLIKLSVNIVIAVWIYRVSKADGNDTPWVWAFFGFIFEVPGAILFYAVRIHKLLKIQNTANQRLEPIASLQAHP